MIDDTKPVGYDSLAEAMAAIGEHERAKRSCDRLLGVVAAGAGWA
jgi:hypothetical protein